MMRLRAASVFSLARSWDRTPSKSRLHGAEVARLLLTVLMAVSSASWRHGRATELMEVRLETSTRRDVMAISTRCGRRPNLDVDTGVAAIEQLRAVEIRGVPGTSNFAGQRRKFLVHAARWSSRMPDAAW
jgi:hypothetical protein